MKSLLFTSKEIAILFSVDKLFKLERRFLPLLLGLNKIHFQLFTPDSV